jgi:bis(5'-nucleosyl)-tetraphosphatase (symmetrical)
MENKKRTIIIGDIHGCLDEFEILLKKLSYKQSEDRLILLGDLLDRGPDSVGVVQKARELELESVMGNHEFKFLKWHKSAGSRGDVYDKRDHYDKFAPKDIDYIYKMPAYIKLPDVAIIHAGMKPGTPVEHQSKDDLMYLRYTDKERKFISLKKISKIGAEAAGAYFWTEFGSFGTNVIYGHHVHSTKNISIKNFDDGTACYGIDTGCCFGGFLSALVWETKEVIQVKAKKEYFKHGFD